MNRLIAIVGPTGVGKSKLALRLAQNFNVEIVNGDSRQVYRYMDIGTAKPRQEELSLAPHHLINIVNPDEDFSLAQYQKLAYKATTDIQQRNKLPLLVGGSGQYIWAVLEGWRIPQVPPDPELRHDLKKKATAVGKNALYQELIEVDPVVASKIDPGNIRRIIRALEVQKKAGIPLSQLWHKEPPPWDVFIIGLTISRGESYRRIDLRVDEMLKQGLVAEVEKLVNMGYDFNLPAMSSIGYRQIGMFLRGELTLGEAIQQIKFETHRFVRHQYTWFQLKDSRIRWFDMQDKVEAEITSLATQFTRAE